MKRLTALGALALLASCGSAPPPAPPAKPRPVAVVPKEVLPAVPEQRVHYDNVDAYKRDVAEHIYKHNPQAIFHGALPPMLPAIVVVSISIDKEGRLLETRVVRSRDEEASRRALATIRSSGPYPKPFDLLPGHQREVSFVETFLFNEPYRFQLRTLAPVQ